MICIKCNKDKPTTSEFFAPNLKYKSGFHSYCRDCKKNIDNARNKRRNTTENLNNALLLKYGITVAQYKEFYSLQNGLCKICGSFKKVLHIDHNHNTMKFRGLLCGSCNRALGLLKDSSEVVLEAYRYLLSTR